MDTINSARRELLRMGGISLAAAAITSAPQALAAPTKPATAFPAGAIFDIRHYGAVGDGRPPTQAQNGRGFGPERPANAPPPPQRPPRGNYTMYQAEQPGVGNKAIALKNCRNVIFRDFSILKGGHFGFLLTGVDNL